MVVNVHILYLSSHCVSFALLIIDFIVILHVRLIRVLLKINQSHAPKCQSTPKFLVLYFMMKVYRRSYRIIVLMNVPPIFFRVEHPLDVAPI